MGKKFKTPILKPKWWENSKITNYNQTQNLNTKKSNYDITWKTNKKNILWNLRDIKHKNPIIKKSKILSLPNSKTETLANNF